MVSLKFHCISLHQFSLLTNKLLHLTFAKKLLLLSAVTAQCLPSVLTQIQANSTGQGMGFVFRILMSMTW